MNPITFKQAFAAGVANGIAQSQAGTAGTALTLNGSLVTSGIAYLDASNKTPTIATPNAARRVIVTSAGNDSGITFAIVGTDRYGNALSETLAGTNITPAAQTVNDFGSVTSVTPSGNTAANVTVGTNGVGSSTWWCMDMDRQPVEIQLAAVVTGTANYTVQHTYDDPNWMTTPWNTTVEAGSNVPPTAWNHPTLQNQSANAEGTYDNPIFAFRLVTNSGTGTVQLWAIQSGIADS